MRYTLTTRESFYPKSAIKVADKQSDAVAFVWESRGRPCAVVFYGKQTKPAANFRFRSPAERETTVRRYFESRRAWQKQRADWKAERVAATHNLQVGHVLKASWGYDQTNVDFYQVTALVSDKTVELRKIASQDATQLTSMSGRVLPVRDAFCGEPMRKRATRNGVRIDSSRFASVWDGMPAYESSYH
jgi:hypothetical protein